MSFASRIQRFGLFLALIIIPFMQTARAETRNLIVVAGELDLRDKPLTDADGLVEIRGPWHFIPGPWTTEWEESRANIAEADPGQFWQKSERQDSERPRLGTYILRIKQAENSPQLGLYLSDMPRYRLWVDGRVVMEQGAPGIPSRGRRIVPLPSRNEITLVQQTAADSSFWQHWTFRSPSGLTRPPRVGS